MYKKDNVLMAIQSKFAIAVFIRDEKMLREAKEAYIKWRLRWIP